MRIIIFFSLILYVSVSFGQFNQLFNKQEALDLVAICNYWVNGKIDGVDSTYIDTSEYKLLYESKPTKMDNIWQLWQKENDAVVINLRGTTSKSISWFENFYAAMIPAEGEMLLPDSQEVKYKFAENPNATIHTGWAIGVETMLPDILKHIKEVNKKGIYNVYITGFSQGGALVHLLRAALEYIPEEQLSSKNKFKVYSFAGPKPGNRFFAYDYASYTSIKNPSYSIINAEDWVPQVPFTIQSPDNMSEANPFIALENNDYKMSLFKRIFIKRIYYSMKKPVKKSQKRFKKVLGSDIEKKIKNTIGNFETPNNTDDFSYSPVGIQVILHPWKAKTNDKMLSIFWQHLPAHYYYLIKDQL